MTQETLQDLQKQNPTSYQKYAFCGYRRIGTNSEWVPLDYDTHVKRLQAKIEALESKIDQLSAPQGSNFPYYPAPSNSNVSYATP